MVEHAYFNELNRWQLLSADEVFEREVPRTTVFSPTCRSVIVGATGSPASPVLD